MVNLFYSYRWRDFFRGYANDFFVRYVFSEL